MHPSRFTLALALLAAGPLAAQDPKPAVMAPIHQFVDGFNKGDVKSAVAACAAQTSIIDEFPPHEWHGTDACSRWAKDFDIDAKKNGITEGVVTLGAPKHVVMTGDRAYVVIPSTYAFKHQGQPAQENGSMFTFALQKTTVGWRITGWSWAQN